MHRYRVKNLLVPIIIPGPDEPDMEKISHIIDIIVDQLIELYYDGHRVKTACSRNDLGKFSSSEPDSLLRFVRSSTSGYFTGHLMRPSRDVQSMWLCQPRA